MTGLFLIYWAIAVIAMIVSNACFARNNPNNILVAALAVTAAVFATFATFALFTALAGIAAFIVAFATIAKVKKSYIAASVTFYVLMIAVKVMMYWQ